MAEWRLANAEKTRGLFDQSKRFVGNSNLAGCLVFVPNAMEPKKAVLTLAGIVSAGIRSFEIWWSSEKQELDIVIVSSEHDLDKYKQAFLNAYPNVEFEDIDELTPSWFDKTNDDYQIFDIVYEHGHYTTMFDQARAHQLMSQIANTIQLSQNAWVQFVFMQNSLTSQLQNHYSKISTHFKTITKSDCSILSAMLQGEKGFGLV